MISNKSKEKLEFNIIISQYIKYCKTIYGKDKFNKLDFFYDKESLQFELDILEEALIHIREGNIFPLYGFEDIQKEIENLKSGYVLDKESSFKIFKFIKNADILINSIKKLKSPKFSKRFHIEYNFSHQVNAINPIFTEDGEISDNATDNLYSIRKKIKKTEQEFLEITSNIANKYKEYLVSENYILKEDRYLLPVKLNKKNSVNGIAFGFSDSGKTILIEPLEIIEINNLLYQLKAEEEQEIARILYKINEIYHGILENIINFIEILADLDFINAKATLAFEKGYCKLEINDEKYFNLNQFYHPLLENPIKNSIEFGNEKHFVVITGPNAGGKSVTLKAIGLIQMLFQSGLFVSASAGSSLPIVEDILIDIGDMQSIEQSLSTFSSHIIEIKQIIEKASENTLVLIDELGTATSPIEGEALAVSILDYLINKGSYGIITSHFDLVKKYAIENNSVIISSMLFDENLMTPKYILMVDVPGYSYAFEIASRLGIPDFIIDKAKNIAKIDEENLSISKQLSDIIIKYKEKIEILEKLEIQLINKENEIEILREKYNKNAREIEKEILSKTKEEILQLKKEVELQISNLKKEGYSKEKSKELVQNIYEKEKLIIENLKEYEKNEKDEKKVNQNDIEKFRVGDIVDVGIFGKKGKIININKDKAQIQTDSFIFEAKLSHLKKSKEKEDKNYCTYTYIPSKKLPSTLDLRGKTVDEAKIDLDFYFNEIINFEYEKVYIIHGKGTGKLANFVQEYLASKKKIVESYHYGSLAEGGAGCTVVNLKK